jgi:hypothetical protein
MPVSSANVPAKHCVQDDNPALPLNWPTGHASHCVMPNALPNKPGEHLGHSDVPVMLAYVPMRQVEHFVEPAVELYCPTGQASQKVCASCVWKKPGLHNSQREPDVLALRPGEHLKHSVLLGNEE